MRRVYLIWFFRRLWKPALWRLGLSAGAFCFLLTLVSVQAIWVNIPNDFVPASAYALRAFWDTELIVQGLVLALAIAGVWLGRDGIRSFLSIYRRVLG